VGKVPFYGAELPEVFAIERAAMDRPGHVLRALDRLLPERGPVLDIGAGDGFTAEALTSPARTVVPLEPSVGMMDPGRSLPWIRGEAEALPFRNHAFRGVYATWAFFFPSFHPIETGVAEAERVLTPGGVFVIANNAGDDEFSTVSTRDLSEPPEAFEALGFATEIIETSFEFRSLEEARELLGFYFGEKGRSGARLRLGFRVYVHHKRVTAA
jgi:ubiquinone/menaquinone biosynthesis C-methylase UbiE